ncbi:hypothetical protein HMPREF9545_02487 [Escherichia coli MS 16-3]|nr:hypothetical protein HMPREF9553_02992 [Escherichia coli MS 200-1]EFU57730.1 hypothetical protein HMPREF9545_02487 [Escherichia coli MS 16-3]
MLTGIFQDLHQLIHKLLPGLRKPMSIFLMEETIGNRRRSKQWIKRPFTGLL